MYLFETSYGARNPDKPSDICELLHPQKGKIILALSPGAGKEHMK